MAAPSNHDFGFDLSLARANLVDWLVQEGKVSAEQIDEWTKLATINAGSEASDEDIAWATTMNIAQVHADEHGHAPVEGKRDVPHVQCSQFPCKAEGVSLALIELLEARRESDAPEVAIGEDMAELAKALNTAAALAERLENAVQRQHERHENTAKYFRPGALPDSPWPHRLGLIYQTKQLAQAVDNESVAMRERLLSPELRSRKLGTRGRKKRALLAAVWQHLASMGFSRREISELVPDANPIRDSDACIDRVRKLIDGPDWRIIGPCVPEELDDNTSGGTPRGGGK